MIGHLEPVDVTNKGNELKVLEFYAGAARLAKTVNALGLHVGAMDQMYDAEGNNRTKNNAMDFNTSAGFVLLINKMFEGFLELSSRMCICFDLAIEPPRRSVHPEVGMHTLPAKRVRRMLVLDGSGMLNMGIHITWVNAPWPIHSYGWPNW